MNNAEGLTGRAAEEVRQRWNLSENRDPAEIERDLDATRDDLRATLEALEKRFSMEHLVEMTVGRVKERGGRFAGNLGDAIASNPVAILLASVGVGWMMLDRRRGAVRHQGDDTLESAGAAVSGAMGSMGERLHDAMATSRDTMARARDSMTHARDSLSETAASAREGVEHAHASLDRMLEEQPLVLGAIGLAAGALVGALLPASDTENRWLGSARDSAVRGAANAAREEIAAARSEHETDAEAESRGGNGHDLSDVENAARIARERDAHGPPAHTH